MEWTKGLFIGSSLCLVSTFSREDCENASFFSKSAGNKNDNSDEDDPLEKLKKKLQSLLDEGVSSYSSSFIPKDLQELQDQINDFLASGKGGQISWGFIMGVSSGFALKKVSKLGALALGVLFILLQYASYTGYIDVNYKKLERDVIEFFDLNKVRNKKIQSKLTCTTLRINLLTSNVFYCRMENLIQKILMQCTNPL
jgi:uncharacterized membrane protein (Fun14 family)